ncbi:MAG: amidase [Candidatus Dormibacteraeota bacterium]|nr:amidase [Candidatus Dormibacteraeota bacterium]
MSEHAELAWIDAVEIGRRVRAGELDPQAVTAEMLARIERLNPRLNAYVDVDREAHAGGGGPLAGVAVGAKESYQVKGMSWTWSSPKYRGQRAAVDSAPIARYREAGAAILGKTNVPELVASVGTVSPLFGATQNPWREGVTPGGSSGGSAAAVAAGLATVATADDLGGSIRMPASCCGVVGLRPTPERIPDDLPDPSTLNSRGVITRSVADARLVFEALTGEGSPAVPLGRLRILAVTETPIGMAPGPAVAVARAAGALAAAGHSVESFDWDPLPVADSYKVVRRVSLAAWPGEPEEYGPVRKLLAEGRTIPAPEYWRALRKGLAAGRRIRDRLEAGFDAILTPTIGLLPMPHEEVPAFLGEAWNQHVQFVLPISYSWLPSISIPAGEEDGLPVGVMLTGHLRQELALLDLAADLEALPGFGFRRPPGWD